jgi:nucleotide-binding universal stress UspA family protein
MNISQGSVRALNKGAEVVQFDGTLQTELEVSTMAIKMESDALLVRQSSSGRANGLTQSKEISMYTISKILVPVDFSKGSANSLEYAASLASRSGADITALHVMRKKNDDSLERVLTAFEGWPVPPIAATQLPLDRQLQERTLDLYNFIEKVLGNRYSSAIGREVRIGDPVKEIVRVARKKRFNLVVIEGPKKSIFSYLRAQGLLLRLTLRLPCPILLAPPDTGHSKAHAPLRLDSAV